MSEAEQRARVIAEAREWIGTPYRHNARLKGVGADCTFLAVVYENAGIIPKMDIPAYSPQAHLHRAGGAYLAKVLEIAHETDDPKPGDVAMYFIGRDFSHGALIVEPGWPHIIHGDIGAQYIIEALGDQGNLALAKERRFFTPW